MTLWRFWDLFIWIIRLVLVVVKRLVAACVFVDRFFDATQILVISMESASLMLDSMEITNLREADQMFLVSGIFDQYITF